MSVKTLRQAPGPDPVRADTARILRHALTPQDARAALNHARRCLGSYGSVSAPRFLADARMLASGLPLAVRELMDAARLDDRKHAVMITGNVVADGELGPTPAHWREADTEDSRVYGMLLALYATLLGDIVGWATQQAGRLIADVLPTPGDEDKILNSCSSRELVWHTEDAFSPYRAEYVGLSCLRSPDATPTTLSSVRPGLVSQWARDVLRQPRFEILPDNAHSGPDGPGPSAGSSSASPQAFDRLDRLRREPPAVALLDGAPDAPVLRIDRDFVRAREGDAEAAEALAWLVAHLDANLYDLPMRVGDVCFIDNRTSVHGRRPFRARYDGTDRWLKRVNAVCDLRRSRPARSCADDRVIG
ncbi:guanitoxin biosynthesis L-enduracididine beta-hydroxylase GntD [Streptomyces cyaneofuscatus]|uniref:guanitoxin biosynthesis L-enduracididine beta-hydroxylase GntD n=1 Tax=Streptomyces cyaneofuscatus TaxID=66883 RepID=UPI0037F7E9C0